MLVYSQMLTNSILAVIYAFKVDSLQVLIVQMNKKMSACLAMQWDFFVCLFCFRVVLTPMVEPWRLVSPHNNSISEKTVLIKRFKTKVSIKTTSLISIVLR